MFARRTPTFGAEARRCDYCQGVVLVGIEAQAAANALDDAARQMRDALARARRAA